MTTTKFLPPAPATYQYQLLIGRILEQALRYKPNTEIVYRDRSRYTYSDLYHRIERLANLLTGPLAVAPGETVGILDYDSHRFLEAYFAIPMVGAILHTINFRHSEEDMVYAINHAADKIIFCHKEFLPLLEKWKDQLPGVRNVVLLTDDDDDITTSLPYAGEYEAMLRREQATYAFPDFTEHTVATLFFTTGTSGLPKAVYFSHRQLVLHTIGLTTTLSALNGITPISTNDVYMPITPMFHVHAWGMPYIATYLGMKQVYPGRYEPGTLLQLKRTEQVTISHGVPTLLQMLCNHPDIHKTNVTDWKIVCGGSDLPRGLAAKILSLGINVIAGYGMSETGPAISLSYLEAPLLYGISGEEQLKYRLNAGKAVHFVEVKLRDDAGSFLAHDGVTAGEVVVRSPWATAAYYNDPERSKELWKDGYLHTGDIGTIDKNGLITIIDRKKDVIKSGGEWISSSQVESLLSDCEAVDEVAVVGMPDEKWTEKPVAVIVLKPGNRLDGKALGQYLQQFVTAGKIKPFAIPKEYHFVSSLAKTSTGKLDKKQIKISITPPGYSQM